jgi:hypothetical protein
MQPDAVKMKRRVWVRTGVAALAGAALGWSGAGQAQAQRPAPTGVPLRRLGVFSLLGDVLDISTVDSPTDSRLDRMQRQQAEVARIGFDLFALRAARQVALARQPAPEVFMFRAPQSLSNEAQRAVADGAAKAELPAWMVQALQQERLSHLLIFTRGRTQAAFAVREGFTVGRGQIEGVGFHLDPSLEIEHPSTRAAGGLLGAHAVMQLTLLDARGDLLMQRLLNEQQIVPAKPGSDGRDPWTFLAPAERGELLREIVLATAERGTREALAALP